MIRNSSAGDAFILWEMIVNPYLEKAVRIQKERGHQVITTGPYAFIRHPMYVGTMFMLASIPLVLRSCWTFCPVGVMSLVLVLRTAFEVPGIRSALLRKSVMSPQR